MAAALLRLACAVSLTACSSVVSVGILRDGSSDAVTADVDAPSLDTPEAPPPVACVTYHGPCSPGENLCAGTCPTAGSPCASGVGACERTGRWGCGAASRVTEVVTGYSHACARAADGAVRCWGERGDYPLGNGTAAQGLSPLVPLTNVPPLRGLASWSVHNCALVGLAGSGRVLCWGASEAGQLGVGDTAVRQVPVEVVGITDATQVSVGAAHSCALLAGGTVRCWGANADGQLGDGTTDARLTPVPVLGLAGVTAIAAGERHTCAIASGRVFCWGGNADGQVAFDGTARVLQPMEVPSVADAQALGVGVAQTCAILRGGTVSCWGLNLVGQLGRPRAARLAPGLVSGLSDVRAVDAHDEVTCALRTDGTVWCWGSNAYLVRGVPGMVPGASEVPTRVAALCDPVQAIDVAASHVCALTAAGAVVCWGANLGQLISSQHPNHRLISPSILLPMEVALADSGWVCDAAPGTPGTEGCVEDMADDNCDGRLIDRSICP